MNKELKMSRWKRQLNWDEEKKYFLVFVETANTAPPSYKDPPNRSGRIEINILDEDGHEKYSHTDYEKYYLTTKIEKFDKFRDKWDGKVVNGKQLEQLINKFNNRFRDNK
jgi:hypothetical protein